MAPTPSRAPTARPQLRGVSHRVAFYVALIAGGALVLGSSDLRTASATAIYAVLLAGLFGVSATLHHADWGPRAFGWLRRADHAMIFAFIAGTYTPLCVIGMRSPAGPHLLALVWTGAVLGIIRALAWPHAPRPITTALYVAVGWAVLAYLPDVYREMEPTVLCFLIAGGVLFTIGALIYLLRRPDPWPRVFGYHEVFHVMIILGCACHFVAVARVVHG